MRAAVQLVLNCRLFVDDRSTLLEALVRLWREQEDLALACGIVDQLWLG
jgi:Flp pilus assembly protein TadD